MTTTKTAPAPTAYRSGWCSSGYHDRCRGTYEGLPCDCPHHGAPAEPAAAQPTPPPAPVRHCATCNCKDPQ